jgi:type VI secretion system secreted protein Hcp
MSKLISPYIVPLLVITLILTPIPLVSVMNSQHPPSIEGLWEDLFGPRETKTIPTTSPISPSNSKSGANRMFIKFEGIDGESSDSSHDKWIDVLSMSFGVNRPTEGSGSTRRTGSVEMNDISITKEIDKSTPKLMEAICRGRINPTVEIEVTTNIGGTYATYYRIELTNVRVTNYWVSGGTSGDDVPTETVALNFEEISVTYSEFDEEGKSKGNIEYVWKVETAES